MAKTCLIAYATKEGQTAKISARLKEHLLEQEWLVDLVNLAEVGDSELPEYDLLIFGGSLHAGGLEKELVHFLKTQNIPQKKAHLFVVALTPATKDQELREKGEKEIFEVIKELPINFASETLFAGALRYSKYNWLVKMIMKKIAAKAGGDTDTSKDYEYTDWDKVKEYAERVGREI